MKKILILVAVMLAACPVRAVIILSDQFPYPDGPLAGAVGSPWEAHSAGTPVQVLNQQARVSFQGAEDVSAHLTGRPYDTTNQPTVTALYSSFKVKFTALPSGQGSYFAHFKDDGTFNFRGRVYALTNGVTTVNNFRLGIASTNSQSTSDGFALWTSDLSTGVTYTVVTRISVATGAATLWINPTAESDLSVSTGVAPGTPIGLSMYAFRQAGGIGTSLIDDLRVGTSFNDVAGPNSPPSISSIEDQRTGANTAIGPIAFQIGDAETAATQLTLSRDSSNTTLVPTNNITFGGSGSNRTVTVTPAPNQQGTATITISVSDGTSSAGTSFTVSFGLPSISSIPDQETAVNTATPSIPFTVSDVETPVANLTVSATSSNIVLVPDANIAFGGSGSNRTVTITPAAGQTGVATINVTVSDGQLTATERFVITVFPNLGLLKSDDFNRPDGPLIDFSGAWLHMDGTNSQQIQIQNGQVKLRDDQDQDVATELPGAPYIPSSGAILYVSFTVNFQELPSNAGNYFAHFRDDATGFRCRVFAARSGAAPGLFRLGVANGAASINPAALQPRDLSTGTTYSVVARYNVATGTSKLWVNPSSESDAGVSAVDNPSVADIWLFGFRQSTSFGIICVDDFKVGGAFRDVFLARPSLQISNSGSGVTISWPASADGFTLQETTSLSPASWSNVSQTPSTVGDRKVVTFPGVTGTRFFRLERP